MYVRMTKDEALAQQMDFLRSRQPLNPDFAVGIYYSLKILAATLVSQFNIIIIMPTSQNSSNCAFRCGFLRFAKIPTAKSGLKRCV